MNQTVISISGIIANGEEKQERKVFSEIRRVGLAPRIGISGYCFAFKPDEMLPVVVALVASRVPFSVESRMISDADISKKSYEIEDYFLVTVAPEYESALEGAVEQVKANGKNNTRNKGDIKARSRNRGKRSVLVSRSKRKA